MAISLGIFVVPDATDVEKTLGLIEAADEAGLDCVGVQDHPYQARFLDTWTLLSYAAARTSRTTLIPDVINLPLRPPAVLAKAAASLAVLTGGRIELGIGAGGFWDGIEAMGGPRRTPKESVDALEEAIAIIRGFWSGERTLTVEGEHYRVKGVHPGPTPTRAPGLWIGAYGPRMLKVTGRLGDGWLPSMGGNYLSADDVRPMQAAIDEAARRAERDPQDIERAVNLMSPEPAKLYDDIQEAAGVGFTTVLLGVPDDDPLGFVRRLAEDVAPRLRSQAR